MQNAVLIEKVTFKQIEDLIQLNINTSIQSLLLELKKDRDLISRKRACEKLDITIPTISKMTKNGLLKGYKINGETKYDPTEIEDYINQCLIK